HIIAAIIDTAHQLAEIYLDDGDLDGVMWAVGQAWKADPHKSYDQPWRDYLRALHRRGHGAQLRTAFGELMRARDAEVPEELDPDTYKVALDVLPDYLRTGVDTFS